MTPKERFLNALRRNKELLLTHRKLKDNPTVEAFACGVYEKGMLDAAVLLGVMDREEAARLKTTAGSAFSLNYEDGK